MVRTEQITEEMEHEMELYDLSNLLLEENMDDTRYIKFMEFFDILLDNNLLKGDLEEMSSWGYLNNQPILIDYGCTYEIYKEIEKMNDPYQRNNSL